jgi:hypothetical protein
MSSPGRSRLAVLQALHDRCLTVASVETAMTITRHLDPARGGLVFSSTKGTVNGADILHTNFSGLILCPDPCETQAQVATPEDPIALPVCENPGQLTLDGSITGPPTLVEVIDAQFRSGADFGVIPGRYIRAEDSDALIALLDAANEVDRADVVVRAPLAHQWLRPDDDHAGQLIAILGRSRHPVALSPGDRADPMENKGVPAGTRAVAQALGSKVILWKTDLAGLDAMVHGALAASIGVIPSLRHSTPPGKSGRAINKNDRTPKLFVPRLLRYVRASYMHDVWFASKAPWTCNCPVCQGKPIDRFTGATQSLQEAAAHNAIAVTALHRDVFAVSDAHRPVLWKEKLEQAELAHTELSIYIDMQVTFPSVLQYWLDHI